MTNLSEDDEEEIPMNLVDGVKMNYEEEEDAGRMGGKFGFYTGTI